MSCLNPKSHCSVNYPYLQLVYKWHFSKTQNLFGKTSKSHISVVINVNIVDEMAYEITENPFHCYSKGGYVFRQYGYNQNISLSL
jgi:hypothetical protein